jgi:hypothetical protein
MLEERCDQPLDVECDLLVAFGCGVGGVFLHVAGDTVDVLEEEGEERHVVLLRECRVDGDELGDVVLAVVGREGDAGEGYLCAGMLEVLDHLGDVGFCLFEGEAAEAVVAAELDDDDAVGVTVDARDDVVEALDAVLGGVAADAGVDDVVVEALGVEEELELVGIGLAGVGAVAGGEGVAEAEDEGAGVDGGV